MTDIHRSALLPYPAIKVYQLLNDVAAYPEFMDGCVGSQILLSTDELMEARLDLSKAGFSYSFTTRNKLRPPEEIEMSLVDGPFEQFHGVWQITTLSDEACKISLDLHFTLAGKALSMAAKVLFNPMANKLVDAVVSRAHELYKK
jgi:ribosome-associated toxin RatA of RatAB toxin-antitoxin module